MCEAKWPPIQRTVEALGLQKAGGPFGKKDTAKVTVKIDGDKMVITDDEKKTVELTKLSRAK